ncbi:hypothetical protein [Vibrio parahaemolyticus]|uniref:hypothetical protein n=1 Tax=Vibrio parahaemolyticus TaxID=670 RepID=UPI00226B9A37|nr:hypothetical protein [Vibrio parahaemolyticus]MCX8941273.1 hypothetical protein [Vibrio parahaemolyticus]
MSERLQNLRDDYGDELVDGLLGEFEQMTQQTAEQTMRDNFATKKALIADQLSREGIDFEQVNNDPLFHQSLAKFDPNTGTQRQQDLTNAFNSGDFNTVKSIFRDYVNGSDGHQDQTSNSSMADGFGETDGAQVVGHERGAQRRFNASELRKEQQRLLQRKQRAMRNGDGVKVREIEQEYNDLAQRMAQVGMY